MGTYRVVEHIKDRSANGHGFNVMAIDFKEPSYVKVKADSLPKVGSLLTVDDDRVSLDGKPLGRVSEKKSAEDVRVSLKFDIKYTGGYSMDGKTIMKDYVGSAVKKIHISSIFIEHLMTLALRFE